MKLGALVLRTAVGGIFVAHGLQKLTGAFGGPGLAGVEKMVDSLDLRPAKRNARAVALAETLGGAGLALGAATPVATFAVTAAMVTAIRKVHIKNGFFNSNGGYEFSALLIAGAAAIVADGPGKISLDATIGRSKWGAAWALGAVGAGIAASAAAIAVGARTPRTELGGAEGDGRAIAVAEDDAEATATAEDSAGAQEGA